ncbi:MAG TPA: glycosyltransferase [Acidimicrobiales bacterium]|nr:glycosyltransferase [Acidimicrobiales bacterium]
MSSRADVVVVDNSPPDAFAANHQEWAPWCRHVPPDPRFGQPGNPKVANVVTGVELAAHDVVVIADDDVRWDDSSLARAAALAAEAELVRPQNYFEPLVWHARWDTARSLINRALGADFPGTLVVRRAAIESAGGYDGDTLFENLELIRTIKAAGGRVVNAPDLFVRRLPPTTSRFWSQRVRQAYDDFALPGRMLIWLGFLPLSALAVARFRGWGLGTVVTVSVGVAELGRRRSGGAKVFPADTALWAPLWLAERSVCAWLACATRVLFGGVRYNGAVIRRAAHSERQLRRMSAPARPQTVALGSAQ